MYPHPLFLPIREFCKHYKWPTESAMRKYVFRRKELGFEDAFIWRGKRVLVDVNRFWELLKENGKK